jgi:hypothetical protein
MYSSYWHWKSPNIVIAAEKKMKEVMYVSSLPPKMVEVISHKLQSFGDLFNFSGVCMMWRSVHKTYWRKFLESHSPLIVHTTTYEKRFCSFYSLPEKRAYSSKMSNFLELTYSGSSSGYLIMAGANKHYKKYHFSQRLFRNDI